VKRKEIDLKKKLLLSLLFTASFLYIKAQNYDSEKKWIKDLKVGVRLQKAQKLYWENGLALDFTSPKIGNEHIHFGLSYVSTRLGSAVGTNAIKQDNFLLNVGYFFRNEKKLQPFTRLNTGFFYADYESEIFDELPNTALLLSIDTGLSYKFNAPITLHLSAGYNLNSGKGASGPGTLFPVFYQMSIFCNIFKK
jgi:predicted porin